MKIALIQASFYPADTEKNTLIILDAVRKAREQQAEFIVFPELSLSGFPLHDIVSYEGFLQQSEDRLHQIAAECTDIACLVGLPYRKESNGKTKLINAAAFCHKGQLEIFGKSKLRNHSIFNESRYFNTCEESKLLHFNGKRFRIALGEDIFALNDSPSALPAADFIIALDTQAFDYGLPERRRKKLQEIAILQNSPILFVNHVGAQTELIFEGGSMAISSKGEIAAAAKLFQEDSIYIDTKLLESNKFKAIEEEIPPKIALIQDALICGIREFFHKNNFHKAVLGLSGGLDSAVAMVLAVKALGPENILGLMMPSQFSTDHSVKDAQDLAKNLHAAAELIPIEPHYHTIVDSLQPVFQSKPFDVTEENIQARIRGLLLMAVSNKLGYILLNASNKSEAAVGFGTLYGDMNGSISVLGDVYKTEVYELAKYINRQEEIIPWNIINKPPSAELSPDQKDSDSLPPYEVLDAILYGYIEDGNTVEELIARGFEEEMTKRITNLVNRNEFKRYQSAPVLKISPKALTTERRMPLNSSYTL